MTAGEVDVLLKLYSEWIKENSFRDGGKESPQDTLDRFKNGILYTSFMRNRK